MLSKWSTNGKLACPICIEKSKAFTLKCGRKTSWFDCHPKFLPHNHTLDQKKHILGFGALETIYLGTIVMLCI